MTITELTSSVSLIENATKSQLRAMQETYRAEFVQTCENAPDARVPSQEDLDYWWPLTAKSSAN